MVQEAAGLNKQKAVEFLIWRLHPALCTRTFLGSTGCLLSLTPTSGCWALFPFLQRAAAVPCIQKGAPFCPCVS